MTATLNEAKSGVTLSGTKDPHDLWKGTSPSVERCYGPRLVRTHSTSDAARLAAVFTGLLLVATVPVALAADASGLRTQAASLRAHDGSLEARAKRRHTRALRARGGAETGAQRSRERRCTANGRRA